jgi:hypothetical protein
LSADPAHTILGFVPASEVNSLGPAATTQALVLGVYFYPGYKEDLAKYSFLEAAFKGGPRFKEGTDRNGDKIFIQHERESDVRYKRRRAMTTYRNYVGPIINQYATYVGGVKVVRSDRPAFVEWMKNCDGAGTHIQDFMTHALRKAALLGCWWVGADLPRLARPDGTPVSAAEDKRMPYLVSVHPANVVDFAITPNGLVTRLVVHHEVYHKAGFSSPGEIEHQYHEWTDKTVTIWRPEKDTGGSQAGNSGLRSTQTATGEPIVLGSPGYKLVKGEERVHGYGKVPFRRLEILEGKGFAEDIAESNKTVLNLVGLLYEELYNNTFSQTWISGADEEEQKGVTTGTSTVMFLSNPEAKVHTSGANAEQAASIINALYMEVKEIHRMAFMEQSGEPLQKRVAEAASKLEKSHESMDQILEDMADAAQRCENAVLELLAGFKTASVTMEDVKSVWPKIFDTKNLREKIALAIELDNVPFCPTGVKRAMARKISADVVEGIGEDATEATKELEAAVGGRTAADVQIAKLLYEAGAIGPVELYTQFRDPTCTPEKARKILEGVAEDREKFAPSDTQAESTDPTARPTGRPEKQPTPEEQRKKEEKQQAANQA